MIGAAAMLAFASRLLDIVRLVNGAVSTLVASIGYDRSLGGAKLAEQSLVYNAKS